MKLKLKLVGALCAIGVMQSASALTVVGNSITNLATEYLSGATITLNNIGFNSTSQGVVAGNGLSIRITLSAGTFASCGTFNQFNTSNAPINAGWTSTGAGSATCTFSNVAANVTVNTTAANTFFQMTGATAASFGSLVTSGTNDNGCGFTTGSVTLKAGYYDASGAEVDKPAAGGNGPSGLLNEAIIVTAAQAITGAWTAASDTTVDVRNTTPAGSRFIANSTSPASATVTTIGSVRFSNAAGVQADNTGVTDYVLANAVNGTVTIGVSAAGGNIPAGAVFSVASVTEGNTCVSGTQVAASTQTIAGASATVMFNAGTAALSFLTTNTGTYALCMQVPNNQASAVPQLAFSGYAKVDRSSTVTSDYAGGPTCMATLGKLVYNAGLIEIRNYVPAAQNASGWSSFLRVINAGATATPITGYFISDAGVVGSTGTLVSSVASRGNATLTNTAIEAALGAAPAGSSNPRLVIIGNTDVLRAQNYIRQPNGFWIEASSGQDDGTNAAGSNR
jgi:hypothetical protein